MKLVSIKVSPNIDKKYRATFEDDGRVFHTDFGASGYKDYIIYSKESKQIASARKKAYIARHGATEDWKDPTTAATLARFVLWNKPTLKASIEDFKKRFIYNNSIF